MNHLNLRLTFLLVPLLLAFSGCGPGNEAHNSGIGRKYSFTKFTLTNSTGKSFSLNQKELRSLERVWNNTQIPDEINICNTIGRNGTQLKYEYVLDDGFTMKFDAGFGSVDGIDYLDVQLLGNGGGFPGDVYWELIVVDSVFSGGRLAELRKVLQVKSPPQEDAG